MVFVTDAGRGPVSSAGPSGFARCGRGKVVLAVNKAEGMSRDLRPEFHELGIGERSGVGNRTQGVRSLLIERVPSVDHLVARDR